MGASSEVQSVALTRRAAVGLLGVIAGAAGAATQAAPTHSQDEPSLLYPHPSATRATREVGGLWTFKLDPNDEGERARWFDGLRTARRIPVPCSWNDLFDDAQDYFGPAWYETELWAADAELASDRRLVLRFGSAVYHARVWLDGRYLGEHLGGYLPFAFDISGGFVPGRSARLSVRVENRLQLDRVPAAPDLSTSRLYQVDYPQTAYDFFPYAGLNRPVSLCSLPAIHLHDLTVRTKFDGADGLVTIDLEVQGDWSGKARVEVASASSIFATETQVRRGRVTASVRIPAVRAWSPADPYLHQLTVTLGDFRAPLDVYRMKIGVRTVEVSNDRILLNGRRIFLKGFGKHEDFFIHGKGLDLPVLVRDFELLRWVGANSFRTSHYPYAEEALMLADEYGFLVIAETPAVSLVFMDPPEVLAARQRQLRQDIEDMVQRDKNHPCVILWSLANEPIQKPFHSLLPEPPGAVAAGVAFFKPLFDEVRTLDPTRPACLVSVHNGPPEWVGLGDVICTNSYNGWYAESGRLDGAEAVLERELAVLHARHGAKPIVFTEFGADALAGDHAQPPQMWSEEYQSDLIELYWRVLSRHPFVVGAHPWAFADFKTPQSLIRVEGLNQKGVFTRDRQPKIAAHTLHRLWGDLSPGASND